LLNHQFEERNYTYLPHLRRCNPTKFSTGQSTAVWPAYRGQGQYMEVRPSLKLSCVYTLLSIIICIPEIIIHIIILRHPTWLEPGTKDVSNSCLTPQDAPPGPGWFFSGFWTRFPPPQKPLSVLLVPPICPGGLNQKVLPGQNQGPGSAYLY
jgi:hypothetical protein